MYLVLAIKQWKKCIALIAILATKISELLLPFEMEIDDEISNVNNNVTSYKEKPRVENHRDKKQKVWTTENWKI